MSKDEVFRQEVASRATNWAKNPPPEKIAQMNHVKKQRDNYLRQNQELIHHINQLIVKDDAP